MGSPSTSETTAILRPRDLPRVDDLLDSEALAAEIKAHGRAPVRSAVRAALDWARAHLRSSEDDRRPLDGGAVLERVGIELRGIAGPSLPRVVNATGVVLHTNLGRAPLAGHVLDRVRDVASRYCALEIDLESGRRGPRAPGVESLLHQLSGAESALVVNNNAAAVLLALTAVSGGGEVIVSRGELVEIGGSFRMPDVMALSGATLVEVGTTNRTRASDFEAAVGADTRALLRVHRGNFRIEGFVESPPLRDVAEVARSAGVPLLVDLGHGALRSAGVPEGDGLPETVAGCVDAGADVVMFSGDKLVGGPQAGLAVGARRWIDAMRRHPLHRALRADKMTLAALDAVLRDHLSESADAVPALRSMDRGADEIRAAAVALIEQVRADGVSDGDGLRLSIERCESAVGGGTDAHLSVPSVAVVVRHEERGAEALASHLRAWNPPVVARINDDAVLLDLRTVDDDELEIVAAALATLI